MHSDAVKLSKKLWAFVNDKAEIDKDVIKAAAKELQKMDRELRLVQSKYNSFIGL